MATYNIGNIVKCQVLEEFGINPRPKCPHEMKAQCKRRIENAETPQQELEERCQKQRSIGNKRFEDEYEDLANP